jgi:hypothetical protein
MRALVAVLMVVVCAPLASAQRPRPDRPYRGLFGGNGANPNSSQQLDVSLSFFGSYDDNVLATTPQGVSDPRFQQSGGFGSGSISLDYTKKAGRASFDVSGGTSYRYYRSLEELNGFNSFAGIGLSAKLSAKTDLRLSESVNYTPYYSFTSLPGLRPPGPGDIVPSNPDNPLAEEPAVSAYSAATITQRLTPRSSLSGDYYFNYTDYSNRDLPYRNWSAGGDFGYRLSTRTSVRALYHYRRGVSGLYYKYQPIDTQEIQVGFSYSKRLSPSRTMVLGVTVGPSIYRSYVSAEAEQDSERVKVTRYPVVGSAYLTTQVARSWSLGVNYSRGVQYTSGFEDPFFSDYVGGSVTGFLNDRSRLTFTGGYNTGSVGYSVAGRGYDTATAAANYQFAVTRWAALFVNYGYYRYLFDEGVSLPEALSPGQHRNSISVGVNLWAPLLR